MVKKTFKRNITSLGKRKIFDRKKRKPALKIPHVIEKN